MVPLANSNVSFKRLVTFCQSMSFRNFTLWVVRCVFFVFESCYTLVNADFLIWLPCNSWFYSLLAISPISSNLLERKDHTSYFLTCFSSLIPILAHCRQIITERTTYANTRWTMLTAGKPAGHIHHSVASPCTCPGGSGWHQGPRPSRSEHGVLLSHHPERACSQAFAARS